MKKLKEINHQNSKKNDPEKLSNVTLMNKSKFKITSLFELTKKENRSPRSLNSISFNYFYFCSIKCNLEWEEKKS